MLGFWTFHKYPISSPSHSRDYLANMGSKITNSQYRRTLFEPNSLKLSFSALNLHIVPRLQFEKSCNSAERGACSGYTPMLSLAAHASHLRFSIWQRTRVVRPIKTISRSLLRFPGVRFHRSTHHPVVFGAAMVSLSAHASPTRVMYSRTRFSNLHCKIWRRQS